MENNYNNFCVGKDCPHYIEWSYEDGKCISCKLVGQSHNIVTYPEECGFLEEIKNYIGCSICQIEGMRPSHNGSKNCESGSIASGGKNSHCSCDICF